MANGGGDNTNAAVVEEEEQHAEAVFLSYTFHMTAMRSENEESRPLSSEIEDARQSDRDLDNLGKQLAAIGDDIYKRYETTFDNFLKDLDPNLENAYDIFKKIASSVFETEVNWGRILTLLGFGYRMAVYIWKKGQHGFLKKIARCVARYLVESSIARWIARQGGWDAVLTLTNNSIKYVLMALGVVLILQFVMCRLSSSDH
ncbi:bcl-2 homologous antagonist/killer [Bufo gargarizans]|uniref:bcl-2 homologous antagonist/killer n=1 Tax=Bufo gargarizans TaxID=30331 RepID=UPI001CF584A1|nr:bcl-2 homologous antagonist/killer [Bufo gargarizans]XP_044142245.1 bcl-2 homologous antagonist/killer [Bufo gargarizans]